MQAVPEARIAVLALTAIPLESPGPSSDPVNLELKASDLVLETPLGLSPSLALARISESGCEGTEILWVNRGEWLSWRVDQRLGALKALFWTFRSAGVKQIVAAGQVQAANSVLDSGDIITPTDFIDYHRTTLQMPVAIQQGPPVICSEIRRRLIEAGRTGPGHRLFLRGVYGSIDRPATPAELDMMAQDGVDVVGLEMGLDLNLAHSLEALCAGIYLVTAGAGGAGDEGGSRELSERSERLRLDLSRLVVSALGKL